MAKLIIELTDEQYELCKKVAFENNVKLSKTKVANMMLDVATKSIKYLDNESFEQITGLKK